MQEVHAHVIDVLAFAASKADGRLPYVQARHGAGNRAACVRGRRWCDLLLP